MLLVLKNRFAAIVKRYGAVMTLITHLEVARDDRLWPTTVVLSRLSG
jgi:hypothetical protein